MIQVMESNLIVTDSKGNAVAMWRRHPGIKKNVLYAVKEMSLADIEKFGTELYINNCAEGLKAKVDIIQDK